MTTVIRYYVEFYANGLEFDYEINAVDGFILDRDSEIDDDFYSWNGTNANSNVNYTIDDAKAAALERVPGASASDIWMKLERDDGRLEYEGELYHDGMEYEFKIDAYSGSVTEWESERM